MVDFHRPRPSAQAPETTAAHLERPHSGTRAKGRTGGLNVPSKPGSKHLRLETLRYGIMGDHRLHPSIQVQGTIDGHPSN